jgi:hypothetical protein
MLGGKLGLSSLSQKKYRYPPVAVMPVMVQLLSPPGGFGAMIPSRCRRPDENTLVLQNDFVGGNDMALRLSALYDKTV